MMTVVYVVTKSERNYKDSWDTPVEKVFYNREDAVKYVIESPGEHHLYFDYEIVDIE